MHLCIWTSGGPTAQILKLRFGPKIWGDLCRDLGRDLSHDLGMIWATVNAPIVGGIIISYKNHLPSIVLMVKTCCHYCPDFYY